MSEYIKLAQGAVAEITEKKSRFIATIVPVSTPEEANLFIDEMKKKYWDAKHNCSAYVCGENAEITRCSDDREPAKTAGVPMLEVLLGSEIRNIAVVVTRYFGGVLLGTGGLVRAYQEAVKEALKLCKTTKMVYGADMTILAEYTDAGRIQTILTDFGATVIHTEYMEKVLFTIFVEMKDVERLTVKITDSTSGKAKLKLTEKTYREI